MMMNNPESLCLTGFCFWRDSVVKNNRVFHKQEPCARWSLIHSSLKCEEWKHQHHIFQLEAWGL